MNAALPEAPEPHYEISLQIRGGRTAPFRARTSVLSELDGQLTEFGAADLALIISELVTNSVRHAHVGPGETLTVECAARADGLRVTVTDPGSVLRPRLRSPDPAATTGCGLRLVDRLSTAWGVLRGPAGTTSVWCELPFGISRVSTTP